eukprot:TRINITY_DN3073_c0_g1_i1.p1 TRINITY_DN3073_c0_g1~~TRINITY_DN3073_c0_g1_i1.p1  ORF type:complete len:165 (-),score=25.89 TRINITY_DN3073_c0_g1_i1:103-576(-)
MANLPRSTVIDGSAKKPPLPNNKELMARLSKTRTAMEAKSQWPGLRYQHEAEALKFANIKLFGYGAMAWAVVYAGSRFAQRFTGPISFQGTPVLFGLQLATAVSAVILINERLDRQLLPTLCEIEGRSLVLEELCPPLPWRPRVLRPPNLPERLRRL